VVGGEPVRKVLATYLVSLLLSIFLFQSVIFTLFTLLPQMFAYLRLGRWAGISIPLIVSIVLSLSGPVAGLTYLVQFGLPGLVISEAILRGFGVEKSFLLAMSTGMLLAFLVMSYFVSGQDVAFAEVVRGFVEKAIVESAGFYEQAGVSGEQIKEFASLAPVVAEAVSLIYPALMLVGFMIMFWLNVISLARIMKKVSGRVPFGELDRWKAPEHLVWGVVLAGLIVFLDIGALKAVGVNSLIVLFVVYFLQGMAIVSYHLKKRGTSALLKGLGYFVLVRYMGLLVAMIGLFDVWFDFRRLSPPKENEV